MAEQKYVIKIPVSPEIDKGTRADRAFLTKALDLRAQSILKVATEIVSRQKQFFIGDEKMPRPMALKDVAEAVGLHESTVNRVTAKKYITTDRGVFELKSFFS